MSRKLRLKLGKDNQRQENIEILKTGQDTEFWDLIQQAIQESVDHLYSLLSSDNLREFPADRYKLESENIKAKIEYLKTLKDYPGTLINRLQDPQSESMNFDPYEDPEFEQEED